MSGKKQHFIPQCLLKGFAIKGKGDVHRLWRFPKGTEPQATTTKDVGAQKHFYSVPTQNVETLDDAITTFESDVAPKLEELRGVECHMPLEAKACAELVAHLTIRTAHFRSTITSITEQAVSFLAERFQDRIWLKKRFGLHRKNPNSLILIRIREELEARGVPHISRPGFEAIGFEIMQQKFDSFYESYSADLRLGFNFLSHLTKNGVAGAHQKALGNSLSPEPRIESLAELTWSIQPSSEQGFILPDCVAIAIPGHGAPTSYVTYDGDKIRAVLLPVSSKRLLIGHRYREKDGWLGYINSSLAECCSEFFVAQQNSLQFRKLAPSIGMQVRRVVDEILADISREFS